MAAAFPCDRSAAVFYEFIEQHQKQRRLCCIQEHNLKVKAGWLAGGGDPARSCWWHVTETGLPSLGHGWPFILTQNWRGLAKGSRESWILRFLLR
jgi:hypothetical protein